MFLILRDDTFSIKGKKDTGRRRGPSTGGGFVNLFEGTKFRTKNGCSICRKRRKRCDKARPHCEYCQQRGLNCEYPPEKKRGRKPKQALEITKIENEIKDVNENAYMPIELNTPNETLPLEYTGLLSVKEPSSFASLYLDSEGLYLYNFYQQKVCQILSLTHGPMNYFSKFFGMLANNEESFLYVITSWGALYSGNNAAIKKYFGKALTTFNQNFLSESSTDKYFKVCFANILCGYYSCFADVRQWKIVHDNCRQIIASFGGPYEFVKFFHFSNEVRFMLSNFQYLDIMSTNSHKYGTNFPIDEYRKAFYCEEFNKQELKYGIDTLQGAHQSIYLVIGDLAEAKAHLKRKMKLLNECDPTDTKLYASMQDEITSFYSNELALLEAKIGTTQPNFRLLGLSSLKEEYTQLIDAFLIYQETCKLYFKVYLMRMNFKSPEVHELISKIYKYQDRLINTRFCVLLCLPMLMCAVCCVTEADRKEAQHRIESLKKVSPVLNNDKTLMLVLRSWEINPHGDDIVDWADIAEEFGWTVNLC